MKNVVNQFEKDGYIIITVAKEKSYLVTVTDKVKAGIMYTGSFDCYTNSTIDEIFNELRLS